MGRVIMCNSHYLKDVLSWRLLEILIKRARNHSWRYWICKNQNRWERFIMKPRDSWHEWVTWSHNMRSDSLVNIYISLKAVIYSLLSSIGADRKPNRLQWLCPLISLCTAVPGVVVLFSVFCSCLFPLWALVDSQRSLFCILHSGFCVFPGEISQGEWNHPKLVPLWESREHPRSPLHA